MVHGLGLRGSGLVYGVQGSGFRVHEFRVRGSGLKGQNSGLRLTGSVSGLRAKVSGMRSLECEVQGFRAVLLEP